MGTGGLSIIQDENDSNQDSDFSGDEEDKQTTTTATTGKSTDGKPSVDGMLPNGAAPEALSDPIDPLLQPDMQL